MVRNCNKILLNSVGLIIQQRGLCGHNNHSKPLCFFQDNLAVCFLDTERKFCFLLRNITYIQNELGNPRMGYEKLGFMK